MPHPYYADPERSVPALVIGRLRTAGFEDVRPAPELLDGDDLGIDLTVELAFGQMDGLFPVVIAQAHRIFEDTWLDRGGASWPFAIENDPDSMTGRRARFIGDSQGLVVAMLCIVGVLEQWVDRSATPPPVLAIGDNHESREQ